MFISKMVEFKNDILPVLFAKYKQNRGIWPNSAQIDRAGVEGEGSVFFRWQNPQSMTVFV
jgi:hypothetical protein